MRPTKMAKRRTWAEGQEVSPSSSWAALGMSHGLQGLSFPFCKMEIQPCPALHPPGTWSERETGVTGLVRPDSGKNSLRTWEELWFRGLVGAQARDEDLLCCLGFSLVVLLGRFIAVASLVVKRGL